MQGIDLDSPIIFGHSSMRYFKEGERHVTRYCTDNVLLLVYDGVLKFEEDGKHFEVSVGQYHIQRENSFQTGFVPSDSPKYLYVHFTANWSEGDKVLPPSGNFDVEKSMPLMTELDRLSHSESSHLEKSEKFLGLLLLLIPNVPMTTTAGRIKEYIQSSDVQNLSLDSVCIHFNFCKNHIIKIFKSEFGMTPARFINSVKLSHAKHLLEATSLPLKSVAIQSGFEDYSNFYKRFLAENGVSPNKWRTRKQIKPAII